MSLVLITSGDFEGKAAFILDAGNETSIVKILESDQEITISNDFIKRKKQCSCSRSKRFPFCDGSHSG